jgi:hypothetical protein
MPTEITPPQSRRRAEVLKTKPVIMVIGYRRYRIDALVEITPLRPRSAEIIPIDTARQLR